MKVISRTSVERYRNTDKTLPEIGRDLAVAYVVEGAVQRVADQVRINVQLIGAEADEHFWAETFDREFTASNLFAIQSEIAEIEPRLANCGPELQGIAEAVANGRTKLEDATNWLLYNGQDHPVFVYLVAFDYLMLAGTVIGAWQMGRAAEVAHTKLASNTRDADFYMSKIITARFTDKTNKRSFRPNC